MSYLDTLKPQARANAEILTKRMNAKGITNPISQAGLLAVVSKESGFMPRNETSYANTSNDRIRSIFGNTRLGNPTEAQLTALKSDEAKFYDQVYGMQWNSTLGFGNKEVGDGYKYRGRGYNGITGRHQYEKYTPLVGVDLVKNPDLLNDPAIASDVAIEYFKSGMTKNADKVSQLYNSTGINDFKSVPDSVGAFYHANAGFGKSLEKIKADTTGGYARANERGPSFYEYAKTLSGQTIDLVKKKPIQTIVVVTILTVAIYYLYKTLSNKK